MSRWKKPPLPVGQVVVPPCAGSEPPCAPPCAGSSSPPKKQRRTKEIRPIRNNSGIDLDPLLKCPFTSTMDLTDKVHAFWRSLQTDELFRALWALLMVLFEIVHEWQLKETDEGKYVGMAMNPRKAILWHRIEFMSEAHKKRIRTSPRRKNTKADEERKEMEKDTIREFLNKSVVQKIRRQEWSMPSLLPNRDWEHWGELKTLASEFWEKDNHAYCIFTTKKPFLRMVSEAFWELVPTLKPYHGTICLDPPKSIHDGNHIGDKTMAAACVTEKSEKTGVAHAEQEDDLTAERDKNLKRIAEASTATDLLLSKMSWIHDCPNTSRHGDCFTAIMDFCRDHIHDPALQSVQAFMQKPEFPSSMRAWSIMPWAALKELETRRKLPRFFAEPTDFKIRGHANLAPDFYDDPGNVNLDLTFYVLCLWEFMTPMSLENILKLSWKEYGTRGEKSSKGPMNFRGNVLEALMGHCYEQSINVPNGYHAGSLQKPQRPSSSS